MDDSLGLAVIRRRFGEDDLASSLDHCVFAGAPVEVVVADEAYSVQPGTSGWEGFGR